MTRRFALVVCTAAILAMGTATVRAHEGHDHKVMGTVSMIHDLHLEVKATDGKATTFTLDAKTKVLKGTTVMKKNDITAGARVVVTGEEVKDKSGKAVMMAKEVLLGETAGK
jgi:hypothetical protein